MDLSRRMIARNPLAADEVGAGVHQGGELLPLLLDLLAVGDIPKIKPASDRITARGSSGAIAWLSTPSPGHPRQSRRLEGPTSLGADTSICTFCTFCQHSEICTFERGVGRLAPARNTLNSLNSAIGSARCRVHATDIGRSPATSSGRSITPTWFAISPNGGEAVKLVDDDSLPTNGSFAANANHNRSAGGIRGSHGRPQLSSRRTVRA